MNSKIPLCLTTLEARPLGFTFYPFTLKGVALSYSYPIFK